LAEASKLRSRIHLDDESAIAELRRPVGGERIGVAILAVDDEQLATGAPLHRNRKLALKVSSLELYCVSPLRNIRGVSL
jgi:hypothetical protein